MCCVYKTWVCLVKKRKWSGAGGTLNIMRKALEWKQEKNKCTEENINSLLLLIVLYIFFFFDFHRFSRFFIYIKFDSFSYSSLIFTAFTFILIVLYMTAHEDPSVNVSPFSCFMFFFFILIVKHMDMEYDAYIIQKHRKMWKREKKKKNKNKKRIDMERGWRKINVKCNGATQENKVHT